MKRIEQKNSPLLHFIPNAIQKGQRQRLEVLRGDIAEIS